MREILFRGKAINRNPNCEYRTNYQNGDWVYGLVSKLFDSYFELPAEMTNESGVSGIEVDGETVTQYTGLTDKNGVKIFEGDIIKVDDDFDTFGKMASEIREVWFKDGGFRLKPKYASTIARGDRGYWMEDGTDFEVIGNVWDNPELLGGGGGEMIEPYEFKTCPNKVVSIQYGIITPTTMWYYVDGEVKAVYEYNPDEHGRPATDKELFEAIQKLAGDDTDVTIDIQAHAASLIEYIRCNSDYKIHTYLCGFRGGK